MYRDFETFLGKEEDRTKEHDFGPRYYSADLGRFLAPDPILSGASPYAYAGGNPVMYYDPTGLMDLYVHLSPEENRDAGLMSLWENDRALQAQMAAKRTHEEELRLKGKEPGDWWDDHRSMVALVEMVWGLIKNKQFLDDFLEGTGATRREYKDGDLELEEFKTSPGADKLREEFMEGGYKDIEWGFFDTDEAFWETLLRPVLEAGWEEYREQGSVLAAVVTTALYRFSRTSTQVGGFDGATVVNNSNGTATFRVVNFASRNSFQLHLAENRSTGPQRTIIQVFTWTEPIPHCDK